MTRNDKTFAGTCVRVKSGFVSSLCRSVRPAQQVTGRPACERLAAGIVSAESPPWTDLHAWSLAQGDFVLVKVAGKRAVKYSIGQVSHMDEHLELAIKFLKPNEKQGLSKSVREKKKFP